MLQPRDPDDLREQLLRYGVPVDQYDPAKGTKPLEKLYGEIVGGECVLIVDGVTVIRETSVVCLYVRSGALVLREQMQVMDDGKKLDPRSRTLEASTGEKICVGEDSVDAAHRLIRGELPFLIGRNLEKGEVRRKREESKSYPGIITVYNMHFFTVTIPEPVFGMVTVRGEGGDFAQLNPARRLVVEEPDKYVFYEWREE